jgi:hypothetical protein
MNAFQQDWQQTQALEFLRLLLSNPLIETYLRVTVDLNIQILLYMKFMMPAELMKASDNFSFLTQQYNRNLSGANYWAPHQLG